MNLIKYIQVSIAQIKSAQIEVEKNKIKKFYLFGSLIEQRTETKSKFVSKRFTGAQVPGLED